MMVKLTCKVCNTTTLEVEVVHVDIQTLLVVDIKALLGILKQKGRLANATGTFYTYHTVRPVNLVHEDTTDRSVDMLNKIAVPSPGGRQRKYIRSAGAA